MEKPTLAEILKVVEEEDVGLEELFQELDLPRRIYVVSSHRCFREWCHRYGVNPNGRFIKNVTSSDRLHGLSSISDSIVTLCQSEWSRDMWRGHLVQQIYFLSNAIKIERLDSVCRRPGT